MASLWEYVYRTFWNERFWLPQHNSWEDFVNKDDGIYHAQVSDLFVALPLAALLLVLRVLFERYIAAPIGRHYGLKDVSTNKATPNPYLEKIYRKTKKPGKNSFEGISKQTDLSERQVERWFRVRRSQDRTIVLYRFTESFWRCLFYFVIFWYGIITLWDKIWLWDTLQCWVGYPHHHVPREVYWYYALEASFYLSLLVSQFKDVKRKDFLEMFLHHLVTLSLVFMSWSQNLYRIGSLIFVIHDAVDPLLEAAKMARYLKWQKTCDVIFGTFFLVWILTRMIIFPSRLVYSTLIEATPIVGFCSIYFVYNTLLIVLQVLHIFWFVIISRIVFKALRKGKEVTDDRSSTEDDITDDEKFEQKSEYVANGNGVANDNKHLASTNGRLGQNGSVHLQDRNQNKLETSV